MPSDSLQPGWSVPSAPHGRLLPRDLAAVDEDRLLRDGGRAALYALAKDADGFRPAWPGVVLIHGIDGAPRDLQAIVDRVADLPLQPWVLCYSDKGRRTSLNGDDLAEELREHAALVGGTDRRVLLVAHSMGGIVARRALNRLALDPKGGVERYRSIRLLAVDTPWHGFAGPGDTGPGGWLMDRVRAVMPDGYEDMRAASALFRGDPASADPVARALLCCVLPESASQVEIDPVFARDGRHILDYTEGPPARLPTLIVEHYRREAPVIGTGSDPRLDNFWRALVTARSFGTFSAAAESLALRGQLDERAALALLERHYPRFRGDHTGVIRPQPEPSLLEWIAGICRELAIG